MSSKKDNKMEEEIPEKKEQQDKKQQNKKNKKKEDELQNELTEEDQELKNNIDKNVEQIISGNETVSKEALESLKNIVQSATKTMTSVPKPFKFLKDHYKTLTDFYEKQPTSYFKKLLSDFLSVLSITFAEPGKQITLAFLKSGTQKDYKQWGFEYLQRLVGDIGEEYEKRLEQEQGTDDLYELVEQIVPYFIENNAEHDAIDLLIEVDKSEKLIEYVNMDNFRRVIDYLQASSLYCSHGDEIEAILQTGYNIAMKLEQYCSALKLAIKLDQHDLILKIFEECKDPIVRKQLAFQVARQRVFIEDLDEELQPIAYNTFLSEYYLKLGNDLQLLKPKNPEQIYKSHLIQSVVNDPSRDIDSLKSNLADTYVNAFVNCGLQKDSLMIQTEEDLEKNRMDWTNKVKGNALTAATASVGLVTMWDPDNGAQEINTYIDTKDGHMKEGACIGIGVLNQGMPSELDPAKAMLSEYLEGNDIYAKRGAVIGLGIAYAGSAKEDLLEELIPLVVDTSNVEISAYAALSLGLIYVGTADDNVSNAIWQTLCESENASLNNTLARFYAVGLGLLYLGQQEKCESLIEILESIEHAGIKKYCEVTIQGCAYVGSGNVLKIQQMLQLITENIKSEDENKESEEKPAEDDKDKEKEKEKKEGTFDNAYQQVAVLGAALIASSEEMGNQMIMRTFNHILQHCNISIKRAVPIGIAILNLSNPKVPVMDLLVKLSHDEDEALSQNALLAMGLIGAGSNNSRLADILRNESSIYKKEDDGMFLIKIAQGLLHLGKGMLTIQPYYSDKFLLSKVSMAGIITLVHSCLDLKNTILDKYHYNLFYLSISMYPKFLFTLDEKLENFSTSVRVGQAIDYVGTSGNSKKITGFQTHQSPVIINNGERAEFNTEEYLPVEDQVLENFIIVKKNPDYVNEEEKPKKKNSIAI